MEFKPLVLNPPLNATLITDGAGLDKVKNFFDRSNGNVGWDVETNFTKDFWWRRCRTMQFGDTNEQYVIDLLAFCDGNSNLLRDCQGEYGKHLNKNPKLKPVLDLIQPVIDSDKFLKIGVNLGFEYEVHKWNFGLRPWHFYSCDMAERCIWAGAHSLKQYAFFSMEEMMQRYFRVQIDKSLQQSFDLETPLTQAQVEYAALDTRLPLGLKAIQQQIISGGKQTQQLAHLPGILFGDDLREVVQIENNAIGPFVDMHLEGDRIDTEKWRTRIAAKKLELIENIKKLDELFIPYVGRKSDAITEEQLLAAEAKWKAFTVVSQAELDLRAQIRKEKDPLLKAELQKMYANAEEKRKAAKDVLKGEHSVLRKKRSAQQKLILKCEGDALINYSSGEQLMEILRCMDKRLKNLSDTEDETLEKYEAIPAMAALRTYRGLAKEIKTYGLTWATAWVTHPCKEEGWLHPGDGKLHCLFNQYDAETGRSTSERPNGQNLPKDKDVRSSFIADQSHDLRSGTCEHASLFDVIPNIPLKDQGFYCVECQKLVDTVEEEYVLITADMSGAELRILAEEANDPVWISAFQRGEDVHSVCTEMVEGEARWKALALPDCAYFKLKPDGTPQRQKCKCPEHNAIRDGMKPTNFGIPYGIGPGSLSKQIHKTEEETIRLLNQHEKFFPKIWEYVKQSGLRAKTTFKAFDMFGRRRLFPKPTWESAKFKAKEDRDEKLMYPDAVCEKNVADFVALKGRKPDGKSGEVDSELWSLTHREPSDKEIANAFKRIGGSIERQGKNHPIQGANATIAKVAMGCGFTAGGTPFLWHSFPKYKARLVKFVHDELVVRAPKCHAQAVAKLIGDAFKNAAAIKMKQVVMEFDYNIASYWKK